MTPKPLKPRKCKVCERLFQPRNSLHIVDTWMCARRLAEKKREAAERKQNRAAKQAIKTKSEWLKEAQIEFNRFIRLRDSGNPCIACRRIHQGQYHASHYRSVGSAPELRFNESNVHASCAPCNNHLSGNVVEYRINLINKIGLDRVEWLEGPHDPLKLTIEQIKEIKQTYKSKCKQLNQSLAA